MNSKETVELLKNLEEKGVVTSEELSIPASTLHGLLLSLESKGQVTFDITEKHTRVLTQEGEEVVNNGSPEFNLFKGLSNEGVEATTLDSDQLGSKYAFKSGLIKINNGKIIKAKDDAQDEVVNLLKRLENLTVKEYEQLKKRKLVEQTKKNFYIIRKGANFGNNEECLKELTADMISSYKGEPFKKYNFESTGNIPVAGALHPLMKIKEEFKKIFLEMGFNEMKTDRYVESSFWNFDSLFQPQNHPSRDAHDTFFIKNPALTINFSGEYFEKVKEVHEVGGYGSTGYQCPWDPKEAAKNILRTHTTAISSRYLQAMAKDFQPVKLFSIDKVFRNESIDATHLAEFHQVEGFIAGYDLGLGDLLGMLKTFFSRLGMTNIKFKPAFNPYTEPSMEVFGYHEGLGKWIEIGNSGVFRPEMLRPMGYSEDVVVIAWGLSLERPAMIKYGLKNIRDLVGHKVDIDFIKKSEFIYFK
ncbi:hypothetical protein GINT2_002140 [Glugoides intestinalis]